MSLAEHPGVVNRSALCGRTRASSIVDKRIVEIERARIAARLSRAELCRRARIDPRSYRDHCSGHAAPKDQTVARLKAALQGTAYQTAPPVVIAQLFRSVILIVAEKRGVPAEQVALLDFSSEKPNSPEWLAAARVRRLAMYIVTVEFLVENAELARAIHCSRQNIKQARDAVETWRDNDSELDGLIARVASLAGQST